MNQGKHGLVAPSSLRALPSNLDGLGKWRFITAWTLAVVGPVSRVWPNGVSGQRGAGVLLVAASLWQLVRSFVNSYRKRRLIDVLGALACVLAATPLVGRAPGLVVAVGLLLANAALIDRRLVPWLPERHSQVASVALPPLLLAQIAWVTAASKVAAVGLFAMAACVITLYQLKPSLMEALDVYLQNSAAIIVRPMLRLGRLHLRVSSHLSARHGAFGLGL